MQVVFNVSKIMIMKAIHNPLTREGDIDLVGRLSESEKVLFSRNVQLSSRPDEGKKFIMRSLGINLLQAVAEAFHLLSGKPVEHGKSFTFRATPEVDAFLSSYEGNKAKFINDAIAKAIAGVEKNKVCPRDIHLEPDVPPQGIVGGIGVSQWKQVLSIGNRILPYRCVKPVGGCADECHEPG